MAGACGVLVTEADSSGASCKKKGKETGIDLARVIKMVFFKVACNTQSKCIPTGNHDRTIVLHIFEVAARI